MISKLLIILVLIVPLLVPTSAEAQEDWKNPLMDGPVRSDEDLGSAVKMIRVALQILPVEKEVRGRAIVHAIPEKTGPSELYLNTSELDIIDVSAFSEPVAWSTFGDLLVVTLDSSRAEEWPVEITYKVRNALRHRSGAAGWSMVWSSSEPGRTLWMPTPINELSPLDSHFRIVAPPGWTIWNSGTVEQRITTENGAILQSRNDGFFAQASGFIAFDPSSIAPEGSNSSISSPTFTSDSLHRASSRKVQSYLEEYLNLSNGREHQIMFIPGIHHPDTFDRFALLPAHAPLAQSPWPADFDMARQLIQTILYGSLNRLIPTDAWIREGLASWLAVDYLRKTEGDAASGLVLEELRRAYLTETSDYVRPLLWDRWVNASDLADTHASAKGAWVFRMLKERLGARSLFAGIRLFLMAARTDVVDSETLRKSLETASRENLRKFFDTWVYSAGHPKLELSYSFDIASERATILTVQHQDGPLVPSAFEFDATFQYSSLAETNAIQVRISDRSQSTSISTSLSPRYVHPDAYATVLLDFAVPLSRDDLVSQMRNSLSSGSTIRSLKLLLDMDPEPAILLGLRSSIQADRAPSVLLTTSDLLGKMAPSTSALNILLSYSTHEDSRVRAAAIRAMATYVDAPSAFQAVFSAANTAHDSEVLAAAVFALTRLRPSNAWTYLRSALVTPSRNEIVRLTALNLIEGEMAPKMDIFASISFFLEEGIPLGVAALRALNRVDSSDDLVLKTTASWLEADEYARRAVAVEILEDSDLTEIDIPLLHGIAAAEPDLDLRRQLHRLILLTER